MSNNRQSSEYKVFTPRDGLKYINNIILDEIKTNKKGGKFTNLKIEYNGSVIPLRVIQPQMTAPFGANLPDDSKIREITVKDKNGMNRTTSVPYKEGRIAVSVDIHDDEVNKNNDIQEFMEFLLALDERILTLLHQKSRALFKKELALEVIRANYNTLLKEPSDETKAKFPDREFAPLFNMKLPVDVTVDAVRFRTKIYNVRGKREYVTDQKPLTDIVGRFSKVQSAVKISTIWVVQNSVSVTSEAEQIKVTPKMGDDVPDECIFGTSDETVESYSAPKPKETPVDDNEEFDESFNPEQTEEILNDENEELYEDGEDGEAVENFDEDLGDDFNEVGDAFEEEFNLEEEQEFEEQPEPVPAPAPVRQPSGRRSVQTRASPRGGARSARGRGRN
jgi:hypothetical protein